MLSYPIIYALQSDCFEEVMVSTDDDEIAKVAINYGAKVPFKRSVVNSSDIASSDDVLIEVLNCYQKLGKTFRFTCCIYPTAVFAYPERLVEGLKLLEQDESIPSVFPIVKYNYPIMRSLRLVEGEVEMMWPENLHVRSQDLEAAYHDVGQFYWFRNEIYLNNKTLFATGSRAIVVPESEVQDIDDEIGWELAEIKYQRNRSKK